jgi:HSP20 family protein
VNGELKKGGGIMAIMRYRPQDPWRALDALQEKINRLFEISFSQMPTLGLREERVAPSVDMWEDKNNIYLEADLPGLDQKDISLSIKGDSLVISAKKEETKEEKRKDYYCCERFQGSFYRHLDLPTSVDTSKVKASYKNGVLKVTLPKKVKEEEEIKIDLE